MIAERLQVYSQEMPTGLPPLPLAVGLTVFAFLLGSIPFGLIVAKAYGVDIRTVGSGNIGMTNVWRVLGPKAGVTVLLLDTLKGLAAVWLSEAIYVRNFGWLDVVGEITQIFSWLPLATGLAAIL